MIKLQVIGHIGKDCLVNNVNGKNVMNFSVAHSEKYKDANGTEVNKSIWVDCAYWSDRTALAQYLKKGTQVWVEGQPEVRQFTTKDGKHGANIGMRVLNVQLLGSSDKPQQTNQQVIQTSQTTSSTGYQMVEDSESDLPF